MDNWKASDRWDSDRMERPISQELIAFQQQDQMHRLVKLLRLRS